MVLSTDYSSEFNEKIKNIDKLASTPNLIRELAIEIMTGVLKDNLPNTNKSTITNGISMLNNIRDQSINDAFKIIYNQCCVLGVAALSDNLQKYFSNYIRNNYRTMEFNAEKLKIKFTLEKLLESDLNIRSNVGSLLCKKDDSIKFEDLQSTLRAFSEYANREINIPMELEKKIIFYQQLRHCIAHNNSKISTIFLERTKKKDANIKNYKVNDLIELNDKDWKEIKESFSELIKFIIPANF